MGLTMLNFRKLKNKRFLPCFFTEIKLSKIIIRQKLKCAAAAWDLNLSSLATWFESAQNHSARFILSNYQRTASITTVKFSLDFASP